MSRMPELCTRHRFDPAAAATICCSRHQRAGLLLASVVTVVMMLAGCSAGADSEPAEPREVTITNCWQDITFPQPAERIYLNESQMLTTMFELHADDHIVAVSGLNSGRREVIKRLYSDQRINVLPLDS